MKGYIVGIDNGKFIGAIRNRTEDFPIAYSALQRCSFACITRMQQISNTGRSRVNPYLIVIFMTAQLMKASTD